MLAFPTRHNPKDELNQKIAMYLIKNGILLENLSGEKMIAGMKTTIFLDTRFMENTI